MANSSIIREAKNKVIKEFIKDPEIVQAIDSPTIDIKTPEKYLYTHIFDYNQNPFTINETITFITIQVHIPQTFDKKATFIKPSIEIWIISHERHMRVDNIPKVIGNRNDYLSELIDKKLNGKTEFGIGELELRTNIEGSFQHDYLYRKMIFEGTDLNNSMCEIE